MARTNPTINAEIFRDRRVQIGMAVVGVLIVAAIAFLLLGQRETADTTATATPGGAYPGAPGVPGGPGGYPGAPGGGYPGAPGGGYPGAPGGGYPGAPGVAAPTTAATPAPGATTGGAAGRAVPNSFSGAPPGYRAAVGTGGAAGGGFAGGGPPGFPGGGIPGGIPGGFGGSAVAPGGTGASAAAKPSPILVGRKAVAARPDPFRSFVETLFRPPAYSVAVPLRLAAYPRPQVVASRPPEESLGPIPFYPRRMAGVLYNGSVSAILEQGQPGANVELTVVQPGSRVPSFVAGVGDMTVESITPSRLTLRSDDNRRVQVGLSGLPAGVAQQLAGQAGGGVGGGGIPAGIGGFPGGPPGGFPGGFPGAPGGIPGAPPGIRP